MTKSKNKKKQYYKPLKVHFEYEHYDQGVAIVRIPQDTPKEVRNAALVELRKLSKQHSVTTWY